MEGNAKERWVELCEQAAVEQDSKKLLKLVGEIARLLREKQDSKEEQQTKQPYERPTVSRHLITHAEKDRLTAEQNVKSKAAGGEG